MSKIAIVGCDASGKTVFVSALTEYFKAGQRIGQSCALIPSDTVTRRYTDKLHHTMRILHQWPEATVTSNAEGVRKMKWTMMKDGKPLTDLEMLDYGGENFRFAFRDDGSTRNAAVVEVLVNYIAEADFIVITVGLDNMIRSLTPEVYREMESGDEAYDLDSEAQWITNGLLKLVGAKLNSNPPGVVLALTQADKYRDKLAEYGGAKALFAKCWASVDMMYPNLNVVAVASVDKLTAGGFPADDYKTDGVLTVMKEFSRYAFGDCDDITARIESAADKLCNMTDVRVPVDYNEVLVQYESALGELHDKTAIIQELYKDDFQKHERFLARCRLFAESIKEIERRSIESQVSADYWNEQLRLFPEMAGSVRGMARYYQRKMEQIRAVEQRKEQARLAAIRKQEEEERRAEEARQRQIEREEAERQRLARIAEDERQAAIKREAEERERRQKIEEERERNRKRREEEERRELEMQRLKAEEEKARIEREKVERDAKAKAFVRKMIGVGIVLAIVLAVAGYVFLEYAKENQKTQVEIAIKTEKDRLQRAAVEQQTAENKLNAEKLKIQDGDATRRNDEENRRLERERIEHEKKKRDDEIRLKDLEVKEAEANALKSKEDRIARENECKEAERREAESLLDELGAAASNDCLEELRNISGKLKRRMLTVSQREQLELFDAFIGRLERAENGDVDSQKWIAQQHIKSEMGIPQDKRRASEWYKKTAEAGDAGSMLKLAYWSEDGIGVAKSDEQAVHWYTKAAKAKNGDAMYRLGIFYAKGRMGLEKSKSKAYVLFRSAKENGCTYNKVKSGVDAWIKATQSSNGVSQKNTILGGFNVQEDVDDILNELESRFGR